MMRCVIDTNILVSALLSYKDGAFPLAVFKLAINRQLAWYVSKEILDEYRRVLAYPRLRIAPSDVKQTVARIHKAAILIVPTTAVATSDDEPDNRFLECAQAAKANYLITGNTRHFPERWKYTKIVTARTFIGLWRDTHGEA